MGLKPTQQRPLAAPPQLNFLYFEQCDRIGAERSILYRQTFDLPRVHSLQSNFRSASRVNQFVVTVQLFTFASADPCCTHIMENTRKAGMRSNLHLRAAPDGPLGAYAPCVRGGCVNGHSHLLGGSRMAWLRLLKVENPSGMLREPVGNSFDHPYRSLVTSSFGAIGPPRAARRLR